MPEACIYLDPFFFTSEDKLNSSSLTFVYGCLWLFVFHKPASLITDGYLFHNNGSIDHTSAHLFLRAFYRITSAGLPVRMIMFVPIISSVSTDGSTECYCRVVVFFLIINHLSQTFSFSYTFSFCSLTGH